MSPYTVERRLTDNDRLVLALQNTFVKLKELQQQPEVLDFERVRRAVLRQQARAVRRAVDEIIRKRKQPLLRLRAQRIRRHRLLRVEPLQQLAQLLRR